MNTTPCTETENILNIGGEFISGFSVTESRSGKTCLKQIEGTNMAQVILTKKGHRPFAIATAGKTLVVPVIKGNIIAQATRNDDIVTMRCAVISGVNGASVTLADTDDDLAFEIIEKAAEQVADACYAMLNGEGFARLKQKVQS